MTDRKTALTEAIVKSSEQAFMKILEDNPNDNFYAFTLTTLDDANFISASVNSIENLKIILSSAKSYDEDPNKDYYKWSPCEWGKYEYIYPIFFKPVDNLLLKYIEEAEDDNFDSYRSDVLASMENALNLLKLKGFWKNYNLNNNVTIYASIYDSFESEEYEKRTAKLLNPNDIYNEFNKRRM